VLIGGLGVGFSLARAAGEPRWTRIAVSERERAVIDWHRTGPLAAFSEHALEDPRVSMVEGDLLEHLRDADVTYDALCLDTITEADIVLVGVSRTSKTPTSIYLSQLGYRSANVSLARSVEPPAELLAMPAGKVVGLVIDPHRLVEIRRRRQAEWAMGHTNYDDADAVREEITWSRRLFARQGWPIIDVTNNAVEETAARIVDLLRLPRDTGG